MGKEIKLETFLVFHIVGYTKYIETIRGPEMEDKIVLRLIDTNYKSALARAKTIIPRDQWLLAEVVEYRITDNAES